MKCASNSGVFNRHRHKRHQPRALEQLETDFIGRALLLNPARGCSENPVDVHERIRHNQQMASALLRKEGFSSREIEVLWQRFKADYFFRHTHKQIAWHCTHLLRHEDCSKPLVLFSKKTTRGGTEVFIYTKDRAALFATVVAELDGRNLNVHYAQIMASKHGYVLDTFMVLDQNGQTIEEDRHQELIRHLVHVLEDGRPTTQKHGAFLVTYSTLKSKLRLIFYQPRVKAHLNGVRCAGYLGLLATVGTTFAELNLDLHAAKIPTIGERAEDLFILPNALGTRLNEKEEQHWREID